MELGRLAPVLDGFDRRIRDPIQLRFILGALLTAVWYLAAYRPLTERIEATSSDVAQRAAHLATARAIVDLRAEAEKLRGHLPERSDPGDWIESLLDGIRRFPVRVRKFEPLPARKHGPFDALSAKFELVGTSAALDGLLSWIEANPRLLRIDSIVLEPDQGEKALVLRIVVVGILG